ncbi:hypothetical protein PR048_029581 [Dryococelus australis]|uniref:DUF4817 domain-containing protein n=1 Tax=Dryococelus australis TaxID=614101 RepID=A0ABQ9GE40_9NEOP|nr:hypothetical protein PR048_029581 [Dryococelus australis]
MQAKLSGTRESAWKTVQVPMTRVVLELQFFASALLLNMENYMFKEYANMMLLYSEARCNRRAARQLYEERFPHRQTLSYTLFAKVYQRASEMGTLTANRSDCGAPWQRRTPEFDEAVLNAVIEDATMNTLNIAHRLNVDHKIVRRVLHEQLLHSYHRQRVQAMCPEDSAPRVHYCRWFLHMFSIPATVMFGSMKTYVLRTLMVFSNDKVSTFGQGFWMDMFLGHTFFHLHSRGATYLIILENVLPWFLKNVPLHMHQNMWFQHDGAPPHFSLAWIVRGSPIAWPARSLDLTPLDYFLWGHVKGVIYETPVESEEDLLVMIMAATDLGLPGIGDSVYQNVVRRYHVCVDVAGHHLEPFLPHCGDKNSQDEVDCFLVSSALRLEPKLCRLLLKDSPPGEVDILFAGWSGNVYALAVNFSSTSAPVPILVYHSDHLVTTILMLEDTVLVLDRHWLRNPFQENPPLTNNNHPSNSCTTPQQTPAAVQPPAATANQSAKRNLPNPSIRQVPYWRRIESVTPDFAPACKPTRPTLYTGRLPKSAVACECSVVGVVLSVGCVVCLSAKEHADSLCYTTLYLPTDTVRVLCSTQGCIVCGDGQNLWLCHLKPHPYVDLRAGLLPVRSVNAIAVITGTCAILAITMYGDMYWLSSNCLGKDVENKTGVGVSTHSRPTADVLQAIHEGSSRVQELSKQIAVEDRLIAGLNLATRIDILKKYFELKVTVNCMESLLMQPSPVVNLWSPNTKGFYQINISIRNLTYQQFHAPAWSLAVLMKTAGETCTRLVSLDSGLSEHHPVQLTLPLVVPNPGGGSVEVACDLVSQMLRPGKPWILITVGSVVLDVSYFLELHPELFPSRLLLRKDHAATMRDDLVGMACSNNLSLQVELNHLRLLRKEELKIILKFHKPVEARSLWSVLLGQCLHRLPADVQTQYACQSGMEGSKVPRTLVVHVGSQKVAVSLDSSRTMATLTCCDVQLLHAIRTLVASRLVTLKKSGMVHVAADIFHKADHGLIMDVMMTSGGWLQTVDAGVVLFYLSACFRGN